MVWCGGVLRRFLALCAQKSVRCSRAAAASTHQTITKPSPLAPAQPLPLTTKTSAAPNEQKKPFTADADAAPMMPFAAAPGLTCSFGTQGPWRSHPDDAYAAALPSTGYFGTVLKVADDCGRVGKPCCPSPYHTGYNPQPAGGFLCWGGKEFSDKAYCDAKTRTCVANAPACGQVGSACCVSDGGATTSFRCGPGYNAKGHFCTSGDRPVCALCPADAAARFKPGSYEAWQCA